MKLHDILSEAVKSKSSTDSKINVGDHEMIKSQPKSVTSRRGFLKRAGTSTAMNVSDLSIGSIARVAIKNVMGGSNLSVPLLLANKLLSLKKLNKDEFQEVMDDLVDVSDQVSHLITPREILVAVQELTPRELAKLAAQLEDVKVDKIKDIKQDFELFWNFPKERHKEMWKLLDDKLGNVYEKKKPGWKGVKSAEADDKMMFLGLTDVSQAKQIMDVVRKLDPKVKFKRRVWLTPDDDQVDDI